MFQVCVYMCVCLNISGIRILPTYRQMCRISSYCAIHASHLKGIPRCLYKHTVTLKICVSELCYHSVGWWTPQEFLGLAKFCVAVEGVLFFFIPKDSLFACHQVWLGYVCISKHVISEDICLASYLPCIILLVTQGKEGKRGSVVYPPYQFGSSLYYPTGSHYFMCY